jgi:LuxR family maltose regulon positive regulatory protein
MADTLALLDRLHVDAAPTRAGSLLEIGMLEALTRHELGDHAQALADLGQALARAPEPQNYVRLFLDEGAPMLALLRAAASLETGPDDPRAELVGHARRLLASAVSPQPAAGAPAAGAAAGAPAAGVAGTREEVPGAGADALVDPLSEREIEVLRLLDGELTGPEIARHLFVSINTLRTHTKRIFTKLDVTSRAAAVRRGHQLGLL